MIANETHGLLRARTASLHLQTEQAFAVFDLACRAGYTAFLQAQAGALTSLEGWLDDAGIADVLPDWPARRRGALLAADLADLGAEVPSCCPPARPDGDPLGVAYVLEGSRFGGRVLLKAVRAQADEAVAGATRFLGQPSNRERWTDLLDVMQRHAINESRRAMMVRGAAAAFAHFKDCAHRIAARSAPAGRHAGAPMGHGAPSRAVAVD